VPDVVPLVRAVYAKPMGGAGCCMHSVTDDGNLDDGCVQYCLDHARHDDCRHALAMLLQMTKTQRRRVCRLA
jgi:hypothetical protein